MEKWEYQILTFSGAFFSDDNTTKFNKLGAEGWELVSVATTREGTEIEPTQMKAFFKRRKA